MNWEANEMADPSVDIVVLNWNGWKDTIDCLNSLFRLNYSNHRIILIDNGSDDNSVDIICDWIIRDRSIRDISSIGCISEEISMGVKYSVGLPDEARSSGSQTNVLNRFGGDVVVITTRENLGFARGMNIGIRYGMDSGAEYVWVLNNDTTVDPDSLRSLVAFMENRKEYCGCTGQIRFFYDKSKIWNCGGSLRFFGTRKYDHENASICLTPQTGSKQVTFITGCAFLLRSSSLRENGLLTENFFFGEEDIEYCYRLKKLKQKLACVYDAVIYHKVSGSTGGMRAGINVGKAYIHLLNRYINMKKFMPPYIWHLWRLFSLVYIVPMLRIRYSIGYGIIVDMVKKLLCKSTALNAVSKDEYQAAMCGFREV